MNKKERAAAYEALERDLSVFEYRVDEYADAVRLRRPHWASDQFDIIPSAEWEGIRNVLSRWFRIVELHGDD